MENRTKQSISKSFGKIISASSQRFLHSFLDDGHKQKKAQETILKKINSAVLQEAFVVLQVSESATNERPVQTLAGTLHKNKNNPEMIVLTIQKTKEIKMIPLTQIKKISILHEKNSPSRQAK